MLYKITTKKNQIKTENQISVPIFVLVLGAVTPLVLGQMHQSSKIVPELVLLSRNMAGWGSSTESSPSATNNHYQGFPEAAMKKMHNKKLEDIITYNRNDRAQIRKH